MPDRRRAVTVTRRTVLLGLGTAALAGTGTTAYAVGVEPRRIVVTRYRIRTPAPWPAGRRLRIVALSDLHACEPWMPLGQIAEIVAVANGLGGDVIVLTGDYVAGMKLVTATIDAARWAPVLGGLRAPLGVFAVLGNHDWWEDRTAQRRGGGPTIAGRALEEAGIRVLENAVSPLDLGGATVWLAGLGDQLALLPARQRDPSLRRGVDDLAGTLAQIPSGAPAILLVHEPDIFPKVPPRVALTLAGHTHGGQVRPFGRPIVVPSRFGTRYAYGHVREQTDLVVSGGLGMSGLPVRFGIPPEIVVVELEAGGPLAP